MMNCSLYLRKGTDANSVRLISQAIPTSLTGYAISVLFFVEKLVSRSFMNKKWNLQYCR